MITFSQIASEVYRELQNIGGIDEDMAAFGAPSECYADAYNAADHRIKTILMSYGTNAKDFYEEVERRTTAKWAYFGPFGYLLTLYVPQEPEPSC